MMKQHVMDGRYLLQEASKNQYRYAILFSWEAFSDYTSIGNGYTLEGERINYVKEEIIKDKLPFSLVWIK